MTTYINQSQEQPENILTSASKEHPSSIISENREDSIICSSKNLENIETPNESEKNHANNPENPNPPLQCQIDELSQQNLDCGTILYIYSNSITHPIISGHNEQSFEKSPACLDENPESLADKTNQIIAYPQANAGYLNQPPANPPVISINQPNQQPPQLRGFLDKSSMKTQRNDRRSFIIKVYTLLLFQLIITAVFVGIVCGISYLREKIKKYWWMVIACWGMTCIIMILIFCYKRYSKMYPYNYIALLLFTLFESYMVAFICAFYEPIIIICAAVCTIVIVFALTIYAWKTKRDFTQGRGALVVSIVSLCIFGFMMIWLYSKPLHTLYCFIVILVFGYFIVIDTQLIAGGKYCELTYDDYIAGALFLYVDIVIVFMYILAALGDNKDNLQNNQPPVFEI
ncbi:unnamed protein product [Blepharisma stoltei]|uniref:Uncharacterized protein n=1 Tax=Blepharisma stoltei TaxID=1481888 RepID=A0AAU9IQB8_9CILI|nr:unnamed protein product [Blepharisma stoltei]